MPSSDATCYFDHCTNPPEPGYSFCTVCFTALERALDTDRTPPAAATLRIHQSHSEPIGGQLNAPADIAPSS
jgi:hypothetical protein